MVPAALLLGGILFGPRLESDALLPPRLALLFFISAFAGVVLGIVAGTKYYRFLERGYFCESLSVQTISLNFIL
jgi:hypothetical protein